MIARGNSVTEYVALLRGISPMNPNMRNEKLRAAFGSLGFVNVRAVISSGNVLFETQSDNVGALESLIESSLIAKLGFKSTTIIHTRSELEKIVGKNPFKGLNDTPRSRLNVTFLKNPPRAKLKFPYRAENRTFSLLRMYNLAIYSTILTGDKTPDLMGWLEKQFGKEITTRSWKTVRRVLAKLDQS